MSGEGAELIKPEHFLPALVASAANRAAAVEADAAAWWAAAEGAPPPRRLAAALAGGAPLAIIAECKAKSPSQGRLVDAYDPAARAAGYEAAGARAVSVLTEPYFFDGDLEHLRQVAAAVSLPVLRKDFLLDPAQVAEARCHGADAVLAIVRILSDAQLQGLLAAGAALGMDVLVEVHSAAELDRAVAAGAMLIGVNNRDLDTFETRLDRALAIAPALPSGVVAVAESGIRTRADLERLAAAGYQAALVGQTLMQQGTGLLGAAP